MIASHETPSALESLSGHISAKALFVGGLAIDGADGLLALVSHNSLDNPWLAVPFLIGAAAAVLGGKEIAADHL